ncbi:MAG: hypothetical protein M3362_00195 [Acidobacteriota bacterium]|nr:hypothetical protein [Acidobacteriota bacterium]
MMTYRELEERKRLNRMYYEGLRREEMREEMKGGIKVSPRMMLVYRLSLVFTISSIIGAVIGIIRHF